LKSAVFFVFLLMGCMSRNSDSQINIIGGTTDFAGFEVAERSVVGIVSREVAGASKTQLSCTATLVKENWVLTAAHCLVNGDSSVAAPSDLFVRFVDPNGQGPELDRPVVQTEIPFGVKGAIFAPFLDLALIRFSGGTPYGYSPAKLFGDVAFLGKGDKVWLAGFGFDEQGEFGRKKIVETVFHSYSGPGFSGGFLLYGPTPGKAECGGDSGGPMFAKKGGMLGLIGVTHGPAGSIYPNYSGTECESMGMYLAFGSFQKWMQAILPDLEFASESVMSFPARFQAADQVSDDFLSMCQNPEKLTRESLLAIQLIVAATASGGPGCLQADAERLQLRNLAFPRPGVLLEYGNGLKFNSDLLAKFLPSLNFVSLSASMLTNVSAFDDLKATGAYVSIH
jgi:hypothetical protein